MTDAELRLECFKLALEQVKREGNYGDRNAVAEMATWFYNHIVQGDGVDEQAAPAKAGSDLEIPTLGRRKAKTTDKSPEIFG